jgi:hypothetical protein
MLKTVSLLAILPALTFAFFIPFPVYGPDPLPNSSKVEDDKMSHYSHVDNLEKATNFETHNTKICSFVDYVDTVLCNSTGSGSGSDSMSFNQNRNDTKESKNNFQNIKNKNSSIEFNLELDPKDLCPLLELVDKSFCKSGKGAHAATTSEKENIDPKDLCPLLELIETKLCS